MGRKVSSDKIVLPEVGHVCLVVRDAEKTAEKFLTLGVGPFKFAVAESIAATRRGKPVHYKVKFAFANVGNTTLELCEPLEGETVHKDFLESRGEGVHHIAFDVDDLEAEIAKWKKHGIEVLQRCRTTPDPKSGYAYMDTEDMLGIVLELMQRRG